MRFFYFSCLLLSAFTFSTTVSCNPSPRETKTFKLNTSNEGKLKEYQTLFGKHGIKLDVSKMDLDEVDADPLTVIVQKISQVNEGVLVEDTSLDVEGEEVGVNVRWLVDHLPEGKKATWTVLLGYQEKGKVYVFKGEVKGKLVKARIKAGFGFDPYFLPDGSTKTLAEEKPDQFNARALAVKALIANQPFAITKPIYDWKGPWQEHE